ncbi:MAG TPA: hypothetical protein VF273_06255 [Pelobium sp.]
MKPKLIILSDLWGKTKANWLTYYRTTLSEHFEISFFDCCELGEINTKDANEESLHQQFVNGGIEKAALNLCQLQNESYAILGFSVGGTIGWKANLNGLKTKHLFAVSSTRLRTESVKPPAQINLFFGENDRFKPTDQWFKTLGIKPNILNNQEHTFFENPLDAKMLCERVISSPVFFHDL